MHFLTSIALLGLATLAHAAALANLVDDVLHALSRAKLQTVPLNPPPG